MPMRMEENQEGQGRLPISSSFINIDNRSALIFCDVGSMGYRLERKKTKNFAFKQDN
jgi:hypothetical protein